MQSAPNFHYCSILLIEQCSYGRACANTFPNIIEVLINTLYLNKKPWTSDSKNLHL